MQVSKNPARPATALWIAAVAALVGGCSREETSLGPLDQAAPLSIGLELNRALAPVGDTVALSVRADAKLGEPLQGLQGYLRFNPSQLVYLGQAGDASYMTLINEHAAGRGELRLISVSPAGLPARTAVLAFQVKAPNYREGLRYELEGAGTRHSAVAVKSVKVAAHPVEAVDLTVPAAVHLTAADWSKRLAPELAQRAGRVTPNSPGQYAQNLKYGDVTLDGNINVLDVVNDANVSVGISTMFDPGNKDEVIAGNVRPVNGGTGGTPRPGVTPTNLINPDGAIDVQDVVAIANGSLPGGCAPATPVMCDLIPGREPLPGAGARVVINADITADRHLVKDTVYQIGDSTKGPIYVRNGATLTIDPGTRIEGWYGTGVFGSGGVGQGQGILQIRRDGFIVAKGTALQPIVFTCVLPPFVGPRGEPANTRWPGCWGGLAIAGNATINADSPGSIALGPSPLVMTGSITRSSGGCIQESEETDATTQYGGCNDADSSGVLMYVRGEYGGSRVTTTQERNGIWFQGVGNHTIVDYVQSHASLDDAFEFFGGTVNIKHMVATGAEDDNFDWVLGWRGKGQFLMEQSDSTDGDRCMEADNNGIDAGDPNRTPRSNPTIFNITCVGKAAPIRWTSTAGLPGTCLTQLNSSGVAGQNCVNAAFEFRQNTAGTVRNFLAYRFAVGLDMDANTGGLDPTGLCTQITNGPPTGLSFRNGAISVGPTPGAGLNPSTDGDPDGSDPGSAAAACGPYLAPAFTGSNLEALYIADTTNHISSFAAGDVNGDYLIDPLNVLVPDFRPKAGSAPTTLPAVTPPNDGFFDPNAVYLGAVPPANGTNSNVPWYSGWTRGWTTATTK